MDHLRQENLRVLSIKDLRKNYFKIFNLNFIDQMIYLVKLKSNFQPKLTFLFYKF